MPVQLAPVVSTPLAKSIFWPCNERYFNLLLPVQSSDCTSWVKQNFVVYENMSARSYIASTSDDELDADDESSLDEVSATELNDEEEALPVEELPQTTDDAPAPNPPPPPPPYDENRGRLLRITPAQNARYHIARRSVHPYSSEICQLTIVSVAVLTVISVQSPDSSSTDTDWAVLAPIELLKVNTQLFEP